MKKILVATDYSENAGHAVNFAVSLANHFGCPLSLVSAISEPYSAAGSLVAITEHMRDEAVEIMKKVIAEIEPKLMNGATVDYHTVDGNAGPTIARVAKAKGYDLIVMGTKGSTAAKELFTGSVANAMIKNSEVPVLAVPAHVRFNGFNKILIAEENEGASTQVQGLLKEIVGSYDSELVHYHDESEDAAAGIAEVADNLGADLLVMTYHDRGWLGGIFHRSTVSKVVFDSPVPLLVIR